MLRTAGPVGSVVLAACALGVATLPLWAGTYVLQLASTGLIAAAFALSLNVLVGGAGMVSLAHAAFFGIGAYATYLVPPLVGTGSILVTLPAAAGLAALASLAVGLLALRTRGFFFLMTTLAFGQMLYFLFHDTALGGGADGVFITRPTLSAFGLEVVVGRRDRPAVMLWLNLALLVALYLGLLTLFRTLFGRALLGIRANEHRMAAMGFDVLALKLVAFVLAGAMAGAAGHMWAMTDGFVNPELLGWQRSAEGLLAILLGGLLVLHGPIVGAVAFLLIGEGAGLVTERTHGVEGVVILLAVLLLPQGLCALRVRRAAAP